MIMVIIIPRQRCRHRQILARALTGRQLIAMTCSHTVTPTIPNVTEDRTGDTVWPLRAGKMSCRRTPLANIKPDLMHFPKDPFQFRIGGPAVLPWSIVSSLIHLNQSRSALQIFDPCVIIRIQLRYRLLHTLTKRMTPVDLLEVTIPYLTRGTMRSTRITTRIIIPGRTTVECLRQSIAFKYWARPGQI